MSYDTMTAHTTVTFTIRSLFADTTNIADKEINKLVDAFMDAIPALLKSKLQAT